MKVFNKIVALLTLILKIITTTGIKTTVRLANVSKFLTTKTTRTFTCYNQVFIKDHIFYYFDSVSKT